MANVSHAYHTYANRKVLGVFVLGVSSGLPWVMIGSALSLWLKETGVSRADIGFAGLIFSIYAINFLWSPLVDAYRLPLPRVGQRRSWILSCQLGIAVCCALMSQFPPPVAMPGLLGLALALAFFSATQDVAVDAYRIDTFHSADSKGLSAASAAATAGWWTGYAGLGGLPLWLSDAQWSWPQLYGLMSVMIVILAGATLLLDDPPRHTHTVIHRQNRYIRLSQMLPPQRKLRLCLLLISPFLVAAWGFAGCPGLAIGDAKVPLLIGIEVLLLTFIVIELFGILRHGAGATIKIDTPARGSRLDQLTGWLMSTLVAPLEEFFARKGLKFALILLLFILIFKLGEAFLGRMSIVFYKDIGYSNSDIATYSKLITWWATVLFAIPCGLLNARLGVFKGLFISGCAMAVSNLMFAWIATVGPDLKLLAAAVLVDGFTSAWATVAFVSFISALCHKSFSATQYALFSSIANFGRTTIAANSGFLVDNLNGNWALFFIITALMVIPGLALLISLRSRLNAQKDETVKEDF